MTALTRRDHRALWWGTIIIVPVLAWRTVAVPLRDASMSQRLRGDQEAATYARELALARDAASERDALEQTKRLVDRASASLVVAPDTLTATRLLAERLTALDVSQALSRWQVEPAPAALSTGTVMGVRVDLRAQGEADAVARWLTVVEQSNTGWQIEHLRLDRGDGPEVVLTARVRQLMRRSVR